MAGKRISREIKTIDKMIQIYQKSHPAPEEDPEYYQKIFKYAINRLEKCRYGESKPACKQCPIHCYQPKMRNEMKLIMRWAGPKMLYHHPILAIRHLLDDRKPVPELPHKSRQSSNK
ncbi:nitrous oxide-stimulated promoter family protein [Providencia rustigianii]|uniref:nitrous oxide-stimulated promoter family protein n=1 Tax=Providencia rustigianii TaxID=158850 RepID=UPI000F6E1B93|nr:nitrous oxide-stimulated promoter family protein [Providencia rustigianii]MTC58525.1 nitrous oxide-stimulated promoter family protein [Providencia rustigianii]VEH56112.1 Nitrous oxide-stimulated promoter [Providencia rustigianii]